MAARVAVCRQLLRAAPSRLKPRGSLTKSLAGALRFSSMAIPRATEPPVPLHISLRCGIRPRFASFSHRAQVLAMTSAASTAEGSATVGAALGDYMSSFDVVDAVRKHLDRVAVISGGKEYTYGVILGAAVHLAEALQAQGRVEGERVALMSPPGVEFVVGTWACWLSSAICVPLALSHPPAELEYVLQDASVVTVLAHPDYTELLEPLATSCSAKLLPLPIGCTTKLNSRMYLHRMILTPSLRPEHRILWSVTNPPPPSSVCPT